MKILILGAGAIGSFIGAKLSSVSHVFLYSRNREHIKKIKKDGLIVQELDGIEKRFLIECGSEISEIKDIDFSPDLVLVLVKSYDTKEAVRAIKGITSTKTCFLTLQNGIGNIEKIGVYVPFENILAGTTSLGCALIRPGYIKHGGYGPTYIGRAMGKADDFVFKVVELFNKADLVAKAVDDVNSYIWKKLLINIGINAITAIGRVKNGWVFKDENAREIATAAVLEGVEVAKTINIEVGKEMVDAMFEVAKATSENISSMYQDILKGRKTEIDAINGAIVELGEKLNIPTPVNFTLRNLIKLIENRNRVL